MRDDVNQDLAYDLTRAIFENLDKLMSATKTWKGLTRENALSGVSVPLQPGVEKYFREKRPKILDEFLQRIKDVKKK